MPAAELEALHSKMFLFLPLVRRAVWFSHLSSEDAEDVVQEAFLLAERKMGEEGNAEAWLAKVVDMLALNLRRTARRRADLLARWSGGRTARPEGRDALCEDDPEESRDE